MLEGQLISGEFVGGVCSAEGVSCRNDNDCKGINLYCGKDKKCAAKVAIGESCTENIECADGLWCMVCGLWFVVYGALHKIRDKLVTGFGTSHCR